MREQERLGEETERVGRVYQELVELSLEIRCQVDIRDLNVIVLFTVELVLHLIASTVIFPSSMLATEGIPVGLVCKTEVLCRPPLVHDCTATDSRELA